MKKKIIKTYVTGETKNNKIKNIYFINNLCF